MRLNMIRPKLPPNNKYNQSSECQIYQEERYIPHHITERFHWAVQVPGQQHEDHNCISKLRNGGTTVDEEQGEELQCPRQETYAPLINRGPVFVTKNKAEKSSYQDIACKSKSM